LRKQVRESERGRGGREEAEGRYGGREGERRREGNTPDEPRRGGGIAMIGEIEFFLSRGSEKARDLAHKLCFTGSTKKIGAKL
jgi:hypothetical protein